MKRMIWIEICSNRNITIYGYFVRILKHLFYLPFDISYSRGSDIADELEHVPVKFAIGEEVGDVCRLDAISTNDAFELVSDLSEEVMGLGDDSTFLPKRIFFH